MSYTSQGTIRVHRNFGNGDSETTLFFVPNNDYSIKHGKETFVVFVPESGNDNAVIRKYDRDSNGVKISAVKAGCTEAIAAATHQTKVEVRVEVMLKVVKATDEVAKAAGTAYEAAKAAGIAYEAAKAAADKAAADKAAADKATKTIRATENLVKKINEQNPELELTGITVPAR